MSNIIAGLMPDTGFPAPGNRQADRQTDADNQRQAWLRQMEMSQISILQQSDANEERLSSEGRTPSNSTQNAPQQSARQRSSQVSEPGQVNLLPVHPIPQSHGSMDANVQSATSQAQAPGAPATAVDAGAKASEVAGQSDRNPKSATATPGAAANMAGRDSETSAWQISDNANNLGIVGAPPASAAAMPADAVQTQTAIENIAPSSRPVSVPALDGRLPNQAASPMEATAASAEDNTSAGEARNRPTVSDAGTNGDDWQKRLIHVAQDGSDLSVSIRDSSLDTGQSAVVVNRLAADAAQAGLKLNNATVNGKTLLKHPKSVSGSRQPADKTAMAVVGSIVADAQAAPFQFEAINDSNTIEEQKHGA